MIKPIMKYKYLLVVAVAVMVSIAFTNSLFTITNKGCKEGKCCNKCCNNGK